MKRYLYWMTVILLLLSMAACSEEVPKSQTYAQPAFVSGTLLTELLTAEEGNCLRTNSTANGNFLEIDAGYYFYDGEYLCYADKAAPESWYCVCNDPDCTHNAEECSAVISGGNAVWNANGRIYFIESLDFVPQYAHINKQACGFFSMKENGTDIQLEHCFDKFNYAGGCFMYWVFPEGYVLGGHFLMPDGSFEYAVYMYEVERGEQILYKENRSENTGGDGSFCAQHKIRLCGDLAIVSHVFNPEVRSLDTLCWFQDGKPVFTDISQIPAWGGYLQDNIIRCFYPGDGYYDVDLLTGERMKLADAQLEDSKAQILQSNCIIETTLLNPEAAAETQEMRFFDGQQWHTVTLPEELEVPDETFEVVAVTSDTVIFSVKRTEKMPLTYAKVTIYTFYQMKLDGETYTVEPMGTFQKPMGISLADQP